METRTYTNTTRNYQLVANTNKVIASGTKAECEKALRGIDDNNMPYAYVQMVAPGETVSGQYDNRPMPIVNATTFDINDLFTK